MMACTKSTLQLSDWLLFIGRLFERPSTSKTELPKQKGHNGELLNDINGTGANIAA